MWQYYSGRFEPMYGKTRQGYRGNTPNTPKQLLESFHSYQTFFHRCHKQEAMTFSNVSSVKTDDSLVALGNHFYKVVGCSDPNITLKRLRTKALDTSKIVRLPWAEVGVKLWQGETDDSTMTVNKNEIQCKAVLCGNVISCVYTQWIVT